MTPRPTDLPDALVGLAPASLEAREQMRCSAQALSSRDQAAPPRLVEEVEHLAVDVELELLAGAVPDPDRRRALVAGEPVELELRQPPFAGRAVHDLDVVRVAGDGAQQPAPPRACLLDEAVPEQRREREARVAEPAEAVVPVADAADLLGQRGRRGGDDAAGRRVRQRLQHHQRAEDRLLAMAGVRALVEPLVARRSTCPERVLRRDRPRRVAVRREPRQHERDALAAARL